MNSAQHLLNEDRADFERALDEALHSADTQAALSEGGNPLNTEQLRTMALSATEPIAACAAPEYQEYRRLREQMREATEERQRARVGPVGPSSATVSSGMGYAAAVAPVADPGGNGAGLFAVVAVLTPMLAGAAAVIFLAAGYALRLEHPVPAIASPLISAGWLFAGVAVCGIVIGMVGLLLTALRNGATALHDGPDELPPELARARAAWRRALLERGLRPFLQEALAEAATMPRTPAPSSYDPNPSGPRMPRLGYSRPDFTSPGPEESPEPGQRFTSPDFSSPDFSSPDFGGPENEPN
jgi:hypothetical protein